MATQPRPLEELESAILAGEKISEQEFGAAQAAAATRQRIAELDAKRERNEQLARVQEEWHANMQAQRQRFEDLAAGEESLNEKWLEVSRAIDAWAEEATERNVVLNELNSYFIDQAKRLDETNGVVRPFKFEAESTNGTVGVGSVSLAPIRVLNELFRVTGLTLGKYDPNNPQYLQYGGLEAAKEAGIR